MCMPRSLRIHAWTRSCILVHRARVPECQSAALISSAMYVYTYMHIIVVEAHCYAIQCRRIDCEQIRSRINPQLIAGRFSHEGLRQLRTKLFCAQLTKAFMVETIDYLNYVWLCCLDNLCRNVLQSVVDWFCYIFAHNQLTYMHVILNCLELSNNSAWYVCVHACTLNVHYIPCA